MMIFALAHQAYGTYGVLDQITSSENDALQWGKKETKYFLQVMRLENLFYLDFTGGFQYREMYAS